MQTVTMPKMSNNQRRKNKQPKTKKKQVPKTKIKSQRSEVFKLSVCAKLYAISLVDPFQLIDGVCIPDVHDLPSWKLRTVVRGTFQSGTQGVGYIVASAASSQNDQVMAMGTLTTFPSSGFAVPGAVGTFNVTDPQYPYTAANMAAGLAQARIVGKGVRIRYIGTELNRAGRAILFRYPTDQTVFGLTDVQLLGRTETLSRPILKKWTGISYIPQRPDDYDYTTNADQITGGGGNMDIGILVSGTVPSSGWEFEIVTYYEIVSGTLAVPNISATHSDLPGLSAIRNSLEGMNFEAGGGAVQMLTNALRTYAPESVSHFVQGLPLAYEASRALLG